MSPHDDLSKLTGEMYRQWEKSMGAWWDKVLESPAFLKGVNDNLQSQSQARKVWEEQVDATMSNLHLPSRKDVVRIAKIATLLEEKILAVEDRLLQQSDAAAQQEKESLKARIAAAEALVGVQERLAAIEARLDRIAAALEAR